MTSPSLTPEEIVELLRQACMEHEGGQAGWARDHGFSRAYVNQVVRENRRPSEDIAWELGFKKVVTFVKTRLHGA